jgi:hypothetical protein
MLTKDPSAPSKAMITFRSRSSVNTNPAGSSPISSALIRLRQSALPSWPTANASVAVRK